MSGLMQKSGKSSSGGLIGFNKPRRNKSSNQVSKSQRNIVLPNWDEVRQYQEMRRSLLDDCY